MAIKLRHIHSSHLWHGAYEAPSSTKRELDMVILLLAFNQCRILARENPRCDPLSHGASFRVQ
jgi:hypothetical protein